MATVKEIRANYKADFNLISGYAEHVEKTFGIDKLSGESLDNFDSIIKNAVLDLNETYTGAPMNSEEFNGLKILNIFHGVKNPDLGKADLGTKLIELEFKGNAENVIVTAISNKLEYKSRDKILLGDIYELSGENILDTWKGGKKTLADINNKLISLGHKSLKKGE